MLVLFVDAKGILKLEYKTWNSNYCTFLKFLNFVGFQIFDRVQKGLIDGSSVKIELNPRSGTPRVAFLRARGLCRVRAHPVGARTLRYSRSAPLPRPCPDALARALTAALSLFQGVDAQCRIRPAAMGRLTSSTSTWASASAASRATSLARAAVMLHPSSHFAHILRLVRGREESVGRQELAPYQSNAGRTQWVGVVGGPGEVRQLHALGQASMCAPQLKCLHHMLPCRDARGDNGRLTTAVCRAGARARRWRISFAYYLARARTVRYGRSWLHEETP